MLQQPFHSLRSYINTTACLCTQRKNNGQWVLYLIYFIERPCQNLGVHQFNRHIYFEVNRCTTYDLARSSPMAIPAVQCCPELLFGTQEKDWFGSIWCTFGPKNISCMIFSLLSLFGPYSGRRYLCFWRHVVSNNRMSKNCIQPRSGWNSRLSIRGMSWTLCLNMDPGSATLSYTSCAQCDLSSAPYHVMSGDW
jgi:hypothetical protein